jgi:hypothetical protein
VQPAVRYGLAELAAGAPPRHVLAEVASISYLMGMGFRYEEALRMVEMWEDRGFLRSEESEETTEK